MLVTCLQGLTFINARDILNKISFPFECHQYRIELIENSESGQNPERYRHCMRGGTACDESQPLGAILRRQCGDL